MQIKVYTDIKDMSGIGEEWLVDANGDPRAVFIDGNIATEICAGFEGNTEPTLKAA